MLNIVILAAGLGKRMQSDVPKVLHPIAGTPMLTHVLGSARQLNPDQVVVVVGHGADHVCGEFAGEADIEFVLQVPQRGTGQAVSLAAPLLRDDGAGTTLILYGDVPLVQADTLQRLVAARAGAMAVLTQMLDDAAGYGRVVRDARGCVRRIVEHKDATPEELSLHEVNTGILAVPTGWLKTALPRIGNDNAQREYYLTDLVGLAVGDGIAVNTAMPGHPWETLGVNSRAQQARVERVWQGVQAQRLLDQGVTLADPARIDIRGSLICGRDVFIDVGCLFEGRVSLADGVRVGPFCVLNTATVGAGTHIDAYTHVREAVIADGARIGPYARLRPGADIGAQVHVGNFVEIKKSTLGRGSKANHLTYIGDATVGQRVNVGAGTITCNYDGVNKFHTVIEDDAFIGSDTQLVAPVTVGRGATLGAGTTLTRDAPAGQLTLSRPHQTSVPGWTRPERKS